MTCAHKRYTVDVHEQTGRCIDCGAEGRMQFVVPLTAHEAEKAAPTLCRVRTRIKRMGYTLVGTTDYPWTAWAECSPESADEFERSKDPQWEYEVQRLYTAAPAAPAAPVAVPLTDAEIEAGRRHVFSTDNPFCPCNSKTMRKAVWWAERTLAKRWGVKLEGGE